MYRLALVDEIESRMVVVVPIAGSKSTHRLELYSHAEGTSIASAVAVVWVSVPSRSSWMEELVS